MSGVLDSITKVCVLWQHWRQTQCWLVDLCELGPPAPGLLLQAFKKPDPKELVRKWQADLRAEQRKIDRQIRGGKGRLALPASPSQLHRPRPGRCSTNCMFKAPASAMPPQTHRVWLCYACCYAADIQFETKKVEKTIKDAAKRNDMATCKVRPAAGQCGHSLPAALMCDQCAPRPAAHALLA